MKKLSILIFGLLLLATAGNASANEKSDLARLWDQANTQYINGIYGDAIHLYDSIVDAGYTSSKLYYNLGNAYFKTNNIGKAILNYNRALKLAPYDKDIEYNLSVANSYIKDRIEVVPEFFISGWFRNMRYGLSSNGWAVASIILFAAMLGCVLLYMVARKKGLRKFGFFTSIVLLILFIGSASFSTIEKRDLLNATEAIVTTSAVSVKSSPDRSGTDLFIIHEGTKVEVLNTLNDWREIVIADGNKGWVLAGSVELID